MNPSRRILSLILLGGVFVMEGFDINSMALAVPRLESTLGLPPTAFGWVFSALLVGLGAGGALIAPLGDRIGRRPLVVGGCLVVGLATLATASATSITEFLVWRLLSGVGLGICLPNVSALSAELAPPKLRATLMAVVSSGIPLGLATAGIFAPEIVAASGWHGLFLVPGAFAVILALALAAVLAGGLPDPQGEARQAKARLPQYELFRAPWALPFGIFASLLALNAMNLYLLNSWIPTVLPKAGLTLDDAARISGVVQLAGLGLGILISLLIDRWKPGLTLVLSFTLMAASFAAIGMIKPDPTNWTLLLMVGAGGASAGGMAIPALCAYLFPPRLLSSAIGMGVLIGRLGAIAGPPLGGAMLNAQVSAPSFFAAAAIPAILCALVSLALPMALSVRKRQELAAQADPAA